jgi:sugar O-acyltransferase (sialic acid O-acetyltransferase NeuD family)
MIGTVNHVGFGSERAGHVVTTGIGAGAGAVGQGESVKQLSRELYIAGTGSFAVEVAEWAQDAGWTIVGLVELLDRSRVGAVIAGRPVVACDSPPTGARAVIALGGSRSEHHSRLEGGWLAATVVHPRAHVSPSACLGAGCIVAPSAVVGAETVVGEHTLVSRGTLVGHHVSIGAFVSLLPGVNVGGHVQMGSRATMGMGAVITNGTRIGADATVAAGAVVLSEVACGSRVQGVPAREYRG